MPKVHLDRLKQRYGWTGGKYRALMRTILAAQSEMIARRIAGIQKGKLDKHARAARKHLGVNLEVPDILEVLPQRSVFIRKGAERGKLMADALRAELTKNLRSAVVKFISEGKDTMQGRKGAERGRLNQELVRRFEGEISRTFAGYARRDPELASPRNVNVIAVTEVGGAIDEIKHGYQAAMAARNRGKLHTVKTWVHHPELSKTEPRPGHRVMDGKRQEIDGRFRVPVYERVGTVKSGPNKGRAKWRRTGGTVLMLHPHDPQAPIGEVAACHCELDYRLEVIPPTGKLEKALDAPASGA